MHYLFERGKCVWAGHGCLHKFLSDVCFRAIIHLFVHRRVPNRRKLFGWSLLVLQTVTVYRFLILFGVLKGGSLRILEAKMTW